MCDGSNEHRGADVEEGRLRQAIRTTAVWHLILLTALAASGCAPTPQERAQQVGSATDDAAVAFSACLKKVRSEGAYAPLVPHITDVDTGPPTMAQLTDETMPSVAESKLIAARFDESNVCRGNFLNALAVSRPDLVIVFEDAFTKREAVVAQLVERKITWAEAARRTKTLSNDMRQKIANANRQWLADLAAHRTDSLQRQAAATALMHWSTQQQMFDAVNSR